MSCHSARESTQNVTCIACFLALRIATSAKIVSLSVQHHSSTDDRVRTVQLYLPVFDYAALIIPVDRYFNVAQIAHMPLRVIGTAMILL